MTDFAELLADLSLALKVGWMLWLVAGIALLGWLHVASDGALAPERPVAAMPSVWPRELSSVSDFSSIHAAPSTPSEPKVEEPERPARKRRSRRKEE